MAETSGFFLAKKLADGTFDRVYLADQFAQYFSLFVGNGVFINPVNQLQVTQNDGNSLTVKVSKGYAFINGYWYKNDADLILNIDPNYTSTTQNVGVFVRFDLASREVSVKFENSRNTVQRDGTYYELLIASIRLDPATTKITNALITDKRADESVCGFVKGLVEEIATNDLFAQFEAQFMVWFNSMKDQLTTDAAGNLQNQINITNANVTNLGDELAITKSGLTQAQADITDIRSLWSNGDRISDTRSIDLTNPLARMNTKTWCVWSGGNSPTAGMPPGCELGFRTYEYFNQNWHCIKILEVYPNAGRIWTNRYDAQRTTWYGWVDNTQVSINGIKCQKISEVAIPAIGTQVPLTSIGDASAILMTIGATDYDKYVSSVVIDASIPQEFILSTFWNTTAFLSYSASWTPSNKTIRFTSIERGSNWTSVNAYIRFYKIL